MREVNKFGEKISSDVSKITDMIKEDQREANDRQELYGSLWEENANVSNCRQCSVRFSPVEMKHHCRGCAGIFCDSCTPFDSTGSRICEGCSRGDCPGEEIKSRCRMLLNEGNPRESKDALDHVIVAGARLGETFGMQHGTPPSTALPLSRGSKYGEDGRLVSHISPIPQSGYCEVRNKSEEVCCVKVILKGGNELFEVPRPSYMAGTDRKPFTPLICFLIVLILCLAQCLRERRSTVSSPQTRSSSS